MTAAHEATEASEAATLEDHNHAGWRRQHDRRAVITAPKGLRLAGSAAHGRAARPIQGAGCEVRPRRLTAAHLKKHNSSLSATRGPIICLPLPPLPRQTEQKYRRAGFHDSLMGLPAFPRHHTQSSLLSGHCVGFQKKVYKLVQVQIAPSSRASVCY